MAIRWSSAALFAAMAIAAPARAQQTQAGNLGSGLADVASGNQQPATVDLARDQWGPVETPDISLANVAPVLYAFVNNGPVFGLPGTRGGDILHRTQLFGDPSGVRTKLAKQGVFVDLYTTIDYENVTSGGLATGGHTVINNQLSLNIDTGRARLWPGGLFHVTFQHRAGSSPEKSFTSGASVPSYYGLLLPEPTRDDRIAVSEFYVTQALGKTLGVIAGKTSNLFIPDQTGFANSYRYYFANFAFNKNPMTPNFYQPTSWSLLAAWKPTQHLAIAGGVLDPYSQSDNFARHAFRHQNYYLMAIVSYEIAGLPGQFSPAFNWSNQPQLDLAHPYGALTPPQIPQAVGALIGSPDTRGLPMRFKDKSWFAIANVSQFLWTPHDQKEIAYRLGTGQPLRGIGLIGRVGMAPRQTNSVSRDASIALFARGVWDARPDDSIGLGVYYNGFSRDLKNSVSRLTAGTRKVKDEQGLEAFYHFALTPAVRIIVNYQHIWHPLTANVAVEHDHSDIIGTRMTIAW